MEPSILVKKVMASGEIKGFMWGPCPKTEKECFLGMSQNSINGTCFVDREYDIYPFPASFSLI